MRILNRLSSYFCKRPLRMLFGLVLALPVAAQTTELGYVSFERVVPASAGNPGTVGFRVANLTGSNSLPPEAGVTTGYLTARRGRIVRGADGLLTAVMDSGSVGRTEGPMVLLPCQNLTALESIIDTGGDGTTFTLTGDVFVYKGRRYLRPAMYTVNRNTDIVMPTH